MKDENFRPSSLCGKNFKVSDFILKFLSVFSFIVVMGIFTGLVLYIIVNGIKFINFKLIYNLEDGVQKGILPIIINTLYVEILTLLISTPIGIGTALYLTQYAKKGWLFKTINFSTNLLASIPSVLLGLFGYNIFCAALGLFPSIFVGSLTLTFCVLPTIIETSKEALACVPSSYEQGALALGAGKIRVIFDLILPCAAPGILTATILAAGKIVGESAALLLTVGTASKMPSNILTHFFSSGKTLTLHLYFTAGNATFENSVNICFAIATILMFLSFILNCLTKLAVKLLKKY